VAIYNDRYIPDWLRLTGLYEEDSIFKSKVIVNSYVEIRQYTLDNRLIAVFKSVGDASRCTGIRRNQISTVINGHKEQTGGYKWEGIRG